MGTIRIVRNDAGNCVNFYGTTNPTYWNACLSGEVDPTDDTKINIINDIRTAAEGETIYEFYQMEFTEFADADGNAFATAQEAADYVTEKANVHGNAGGGFTLTSTDTLDMYRDATNTTVLFDDGSAHAVNSIQAVVADDGTITIQTKGDEPTALYTGLFHTNVYIGGTLITGTAQGVVNNLNALFQVTPLGLGGTDPEPEFPTLDGVDITATERNTIDPIGTDIAAPAANGQWGWYTSDETIDAVGEHYTIKVTGHGRWVLGLASENDGDFTELTSAAITDANAGLKWGMAFYDYGSYMGAWQLYGSNKGYIMGPGWSNSTLGYRYQTDIQADLLAGNPSLFKVGIDDNGFASVSYWRNATNEWVMVARSNYVLPDGNYKLVSKLYEQGGGVKITETAKRVAVDPAAPTLYERWIESPDGTFIYPLYASAEEANYKDTQNGGGGTSATRTYVDDASNTTWYIPTTGATENGVSAPSTGTEIPTQDDALFAPTAFSANAITQEEGTAVNIQVTPAGATWSTSVDISPAGSGLVFDGYSLVQGTLADVGADTTYTITVTRANAYGSSVGTMTVTATNLAPVQTLTTPWTKALDFSGSSERTIQVNNSYLYTPLKMGGINNNVPGNTTAGYTSADANSRPWATACVFKVDGHNSNQHIWNLGEGAGTTDDNIYLRLDASRNLYFGWGRTGEINELLVGVNLSTTQWYGAYIAHTGERLGAADATAANLADCFRVHLFSSGTNWQIASATNSSTEALWGHTSSSTGARMNREFTGDFTIGGRGANRSFHGKVASMVVTTLRTNVAMPTDAEIEMMVTDPLRWLNDYKVGNPYRLPNNLADSSSFSLDSYDALHATQVLLMGDGEYDGFAQIRNQVWPENQNRTAINMISMVSNDIQSITIPGLDA